jgi:hypothetical protein
VEVFNQQEIVVMSGSERMIRVTMGEA